MTAVVLQNTFPREERVATFGQKLVKMRNSMGWSQQRLSDVLGDISKSKVSDWEIGKYQPNRIEIARIADLFGVDLEYLVRDEVDQPHKPAVTPDEKVILQIVHALDLSVNDVIRGLNMVRKDEPPKRTGASPTISERNLSSERARKLDEEKGKGRKGS